MYVPYTSTATNAILTAKTAPTGGSFVVSILKSSNNGSTFPTTVVTITLTTGNNVVTTTSFTNSGLTAGDLLRIDITSVNGAADWNAFLISE